MPSAPNTDDNGTDQPDINPGTQRGAAASSDEVPSSSDAGEAEGGPGRHADEADQVTTDTGDSEDETEGKSEGEPFPPRGALTLRALRWGGLIGAVVFGLIALVLRRECREPLQHIIGRMWLRGAELISRPGVFIVRPETEVVAGAAIEAAREVMAGGGGVVLTADLCTGSGAIAACVAKEVPGARVVAVEISETAATLARENCERLVPGRVEVIHADATDPLVLHDLNGQVDVVVSNPPYVPAGAVEDAETSQHEPTVALYGGGPDGLDIPIDVLVRSVALLRTGGVLVMEHDHEQGALLRAAALGAGFKQAETGQDLTGRDRYLRAVR